MVIIHGSGAVRAGQWSRKLIINENINTGSQFPYIRQAIADGYGVIVMNPNLNEITVNGKPSKVKVSHSNYHGKFYFLFSFCFLWFYTSLSKKITCAFFFYYFVKNIQHTKSLGVMHFLLLGDESTGVYQCDMFLFNKIENSNN